MDLTQNSKDQFFRAINNEVEISTFYQKQEFIIQTAQQIIKDFSEFGIEITFSGDTSNAYPELFTQLCNNLSPIIKDQYQTLINLLYRIDLSMDQIRKSTEIRPDIDVVEILSDLIIKRELKKVLLRYYFKHYDQK